MSQAVVAQTIAADGRKANVHQGALVLLAPDGGIRALVGGTSHRLSAYNRAIQAERQPGSSFKPFVYAAALENGVKPTDIRQDAPVRFGPWAPTNYEGSYSGAVTVADALARSINTVAVRLASEVGGPRIGEIAHRFGFKSIPDAPNLSVALGAYEVNLLELTGAFQVFQQAGQRNEPYLIEEIRTSRGDSLYAHQQSQAQPVYDSAHAADMVRMMEGVLAHGTGTRAAFGRPAAGKTGTTQNWRDAWFVGFTPDWVLGVWIGNDDDQPMNKITGGQIPAEIWRRVMIAAHDGVPSHDFTWMGPETPAAPAEVATDAPAVDGAKDKGAFYDGLTNDFSTASQDPSAPLPPDAAPAPTAPAAPKPMPEPKVTPPEDINGDPRP
jgi:penicillin-binding protein 1A